MVPRKKKRPKKPNEWERASAAAAAANEVSLLRYGDRIFKILLEEN